MRIRTLLLAGVCIAAPALAQTPNTAQQQGTAQQEQGLRQGDRDHRMHAQQREGQGAQAEPREGSQRREAADRDQRQDGQQLRSEQQRSEDRDRLSNGWRAPNQRQDTAADRDRRERETAMDRERRERSGATVGLESRERREREGVAVQLQPRERRQTSVDLELRERQGWAKPGPWVEERQRPTAQGSVVEERQRLAMPVPGGPMPSNGRGPRYDVEAQGGQGPAFQYQGQPAYRGGPGAGEPSYGVQGTQPGLSAEEEAARMRADRGYATMDDQNQALQEQQEHQQWMNRQGRREQARSRREWRRLDDFGTYGAAPPGPLPPGYERPAPAYGPPTVYYPPSSAYVPPRYYAPEVPYAEVPAYPPPGPRHWRAPGVYDEYVPE